MVIVTCKCHIYLRLDCDDTVCNTCSGDVVALLCGPLSVYVRVTSTAMDIAGISQRGVITAVKNPDSRDPVDVLSD